MFLPLLQVIPARASPGQIVADIAPVGPENTRLDRVAGLFDVTLHPDPVMARRPVVADGMTGPAAVFLWDRARRGWAAGLSQVVYDNRDRGHAVPAIERLPQLGQTRYAEVFRQRSLDYGLAQMRFSQPVIGNSSTAVTRGPFRRSLARLAMSDRDQAQRAFDLYAANHLYFYPTHRDFEAENGDRFFANAPFLVAAWGKSGSEKGLLWASLLAVAALRPDTFARLRDDGLLAVALQMLLRRSRKGIETESAYLSGPAHPSAFAGESVDNLALVTRASELRPEAIPPMVRLSVLQEFPAVPGRDYLDSARTEEVFTTPVAIARVWRSLAWARDIVLSADRTRDPNGRPLTFDWVILRGDPARITISHPAGDIARQQARIRVAWHDPYPAPGAPRIQTSRIDIGVFARNGAEISAPSMFSVVFPAHQGRIYSPAPDGGMRIAQVSYIPRGYADPALWAVGDWTDRYDYPPDDAGPVRITRQPRKGAAQALVLGPDGLMRRAGQTAPLVHAGDWTGTGVAVLRPR